jgi:hypothetical protein
MPSREAVTVGRNDETLRKKARRGSIGEIIEDSSGRSWIITKRDKAHSEGFVSIPAITLRPLEPLFVLLGRPFYSPSKTLFG